MELLISLLVFVLVAAIVLWLISTIVNALPMPAWVRNVVLALAALLLLLALLNEVGWVW